MQIYMHAAVFLYIYIPYVISQTCSESQPICLISLEFGAEDMTWLASTIHWLSNNVTFEWMALNQSLAIAASGNLMMQVDFPSGECNSMVRFSGSDMLRFLHR